MNNQQRIRSYFIRSVCISTMCICLGLIYVFGVEKKTIFEIFAGFFSGGVIGGLAGLLVFLFIGTIGWVAAGVFFGALGLFSLVAGGILGGLGLGSVVDVIRNPGDYSFNLFVISIWFACKCYALYVGAQICWKVLR
jgi:hypothetical protein